MSKNNKNSQIFSSDAKMSNASLVSPRPWEPSDFFETKDCMPTTQHSKQKHGDGPWEDRIFTIYLGTKFTCKKCGYTFSQKFSEISFSTDNRPQDQADRKMLDHLKNFHILEIVG